MQSVTEREIEQQVGNGVSKLTIAMERNTAIPHPGRKAPIERPRMRLVDGAEAKLASYEAFQQDGRMQWAVAAKMIRQASIRNCQGALEVLWPVFGSRKAV